jgi:hypothetical protein
LCVCGRGFLEGHERSELAQAKSEANKQATNFVLAKTSNFFYSVLALSCIKVELNCPAFNNSVLFIRFN